MGLVAISSKGRSDLAKKKRARPSLTGAERLSALKRQHSTLDEQIGKLPAGDLSQVELKKRKLRLKDQIAQIEHMAVAAE